MYVDKTIAWAIVVIVFLAMVGFILYNLWLERRWKAIEAFEAYCEQIIKKKTTYPYPDILGVSEHRYISLELEKYRKKKPSRRTLLNSTKKLTIENWFSQEDQRHLFGRSLSEITPSPSKKVVESNKKVKNG